MCATRPLRWLRRVLGGSLWRLRRRFRRRNTADVLDAEHGWHMRPGDLAGHNACLFVTYAAGGYIPEHAILHARRWAEHGFEVVLVVALDDPASFRPAGDLGFCAGILARRNEGYDFGAWAAAIRLLPDLRDAKMVAIANDSVYGPLDGFAATLARMRASPADVVGLTESLEIRRHFQSFTLLFKGAAPASEAFRSFWHGVRSGDRRHAIDRYELPLVAQMEAAGLAAEALWPADRRDPGRNATLTRWRDLIADGFPYLKVQLLRDNPCSADIAGWPDVVAAHGYDPGLIRRHLAGQTRRRS